MSGCYSIKEIRKLQSETRNMTTKTQLLVHVHVGPLIVHEITESMILQIYKHFRDFIKFLLDNLTVLHMDVYAAEGPDKS